MIQNSLRILIVDDDAPVLMVLGNILSKRGYTIYKASTARQAFHILKTVAIDFIISDIVMPDINGIQFIQTYRKLNKSTPILILSGSSSKHTVQEAAKAGANSYLTKPFDTNTLLSRIEGIAQKMGL